MGSQTSIRRKDLDAINEKLEEMDMQRETATE
jgi:hypothetical protein